MNLDRLHKLIGAIPDDDKFKPVIIEIADLLSWVGEWIQELDKRTESRSEEA